MSRGKDSFAVRLTRVCKKYTVSHQKPSLVGNILGQRKEEEFWALKDINLVVKKGDRVGIVGPNGAGKTTLLKIVAGITQPTSGEVEVNGKLVSLINFSAGFHPELTGEENIFLNGVLAGMSKKVIRKKYKQVLEFADIGEFIDAPFFTYSDGMKFRLAFAVAVASGCEILAIDEIFMSSDLDFSDKSYSLLKELQKKKTMIISSHNINFLYKFCTRTVRIKKGQIHEPFELLQFFLDFPKGEEFITKVASNSMYPAVKKGDRIKIRKEPYESLEIGDVVAFYLENISEIVLHRLVQKQQKKKASIYLTRGDNWFNVDDWYVDKKNYIGKVVGIYN